MAYYGAMTLRQQRELDSSIGGVAKKYALAARISNLEALAGGVGGYALGDDEVLKFGTGGQASPDNYDVKASFDGTNLVFEGYSERIAKVLFNDLEVNIGEFGNTAGSGLPMDADSGAFRVYTDDDGVSMTGSRRGILSRMLFTVDQTSGETYRALQGQIKVVNDKDLNHANHVISCVEGYLELDGVSNRTIDGHVACVRAAIEEGASGTTTIDATGVFSGFEATLNSTRTYAETGEMAAFVANTSSGTSKWTKAFYAQTNHANRGVVIGDYASTADNGLDQNAATWLNGFFADDSGSAMTGDKRNLLARTCLTVDQSGAVTINAIRGQIKALDGIDVSNAGAVVSPIRGYLELAGTGARTLTGHVASIRAAIEEGASGTTTVAADSFYSGVEACLNSTRTYTLTGVMSAFTTTISGGASQWYYGLYNQVGAVFGDVKVQAEDAGSLPCVIFSGAAANDGDIATAVGADSLWADGSLYISVVDGAGKLFQKQNDTWVDLQA